MILRRTLRHTGLMAGLLVVGACGEAPPPPEQGEPELSGIDAGVDFVVPSSVTGHLEWEEGTLRFQPCEESPPPRPVEDATGGEARRLVDELGYGDGRVRAAVVLDGPRLVEVRYAMPESGADCREFLPDGDAVGRGNEPFWNLLVRGGDAVWTTPENLEGTAFGDGVWSRPDSSTWRFEARRDGVDGVEYVTLTLIEEVCRDTMAGGRFPFTATAEIGGERFEGCGLEGRGAASRP